MDARARRRPMNARTRSAMFALSFLEYLTTRRRLRWYPSILAFFLLLSAYSTLRVNDERDIHATPTTAPATIYVTDFQLAPGSFWTPCLAARRSGLRCSTTAIWMNTRRSVAISVNPSAMVQTGCATMSSGAVAGRASCSLPRVALPALSPERSDSRPQYARIHA